MNERIRELAKQAGMLDFSQVSGGRYKVTEVDIEEFAQLIVQECMDCATWVGTVNKNPIEPINTAYAINKRIKKYFGVEK